jgi:VWFA-related protein
MSDTSVIGSRFLKAAALLLCSACFVSAQEKAQPSPGAQSAEASNVVFKSVVNRVILDVVVTDSEGKPVHGLTRQDFSVGEDSSPQKVLSFDVHDLDSVDPHDLESAPEFTKAASLPPNTLVNAPRALEHGPLNVLLLDLVNTETGDQAYARRQLLQFISSKPKGTRFAIFVLSDGLHLVQGFTDDEKRLSQVLDPAHPSPHLPRVFLYQNNYGRGEIGMMVSVFTFISRFLDGLPGRKNLIWFSGEFPIQLFPHDGDELNYRDEAKVALDTMARGQVAVYPVDIRTVMVNNPHAPAGSTGTGGVPYDFHDGGAPEPSPDLSPGAVSPAASSGGMQLQPTGVSFSNVAQTGGAEGYSLIANSYMVQDEIARTTGGRAFHGDNGLKDVLAEAVEDGSNYYTLTYAPSNQHYNGALRNIQVELDKKGYHLSYRRAYYAYDPNVPLLEKEKEKGKEKDKNHRAGDSSEPPRKLGDSLYANMQHGAPLVHEIFFRAHLRTLGPPAQATSAQMSNLVEQPAFFQVRRKSHSSTPLLSIQLQPYLIDYSFTASPLKPGSAAHSLLPPKVEVAVAAYDENGRMLNASVETSSPSEPVNAADPDHIFRVQQQIDVPVNAKSIRVAMRDISTDRIGAMEVNLPLAPEAEAQATGPAQP